MNVSSVPKYSIHLSFIHPESHQRFAHSDSPFGPVTPLHSFITFVTLPGTSFHIHCQFQAQTPHLNLPTEICIPGVQHFYCPVSHPTPNTISCPFSYSEILFFHPLTEAGSAPFAAGVISSIMKRKGKKKKEI